MNSLQNWKRRLVFWFGAFAVGSVASIFALASNFAQDVFQKSLAISPYLPIIITPVGLALSVMLTRLFFPGAQGSGIPQTLAALEITDDDARNKLLSPRITIGKILLSLLGLLSGASIGREGPTVQIGASIMHGLGRLANFPQHDLEKGLILAGGAAGISAAFNTPLAGVVFAIEEMSRSFEHSTSGTILITVIVAGVASLDILGNYAYFGHSSVTLDLGKGWLAIVLCGVAGGVLGGLFSRILIATSNGLPGKLGILMKKNPVAFAALCGVVLAILGIASGSTIYGTGYAEARGILNGTQVTVGYGFFKMAATLVSYLSGIPGGIFSPSISVGAGLGALIATVLPNVPLSAVTILGMVAYFSGVVQAPITAFVIVMEMTDNHNMILPLMSAAFIANAISKRICPSPLYYTLAQRFMPIRSVQ